MFSFICPQKILFGRGQCQQAATLAATFGQVVLLIHGSDPSRAQWLIDGCRAAGLTMNTISCGREPSLPNIEVALTQLDGMRPDVVVALGGGSVIDFAKALAALIPCSGKPASYLEVVGDGRRLEHETIPMIALPTTAGTGAEVTKNAVISVPEHGLKVSLRDPQMLPEIAIIDPSLMQGAPKHVTLAAGLDAITQVIEPYLSLKANPMTDALCRSAIPIGLSVLKDLVENDAQAAWDSMAWVSTCGGLALANAGLGAVHGFAGVIGGKTNAPHGEICGALLPAVLESHLRKAQPQSDIFDRLHWILHQIDAHFADGIKGSGISELHRWSQNMGLRGLADMKLSDTHYSEIAAAASKASSMKGNPFPLARHELVAILRCAE
ncbi:putative iron-containing alcohol dehydrogenase [Octadecabacter antarcticus 307]|uniref:Putative iron-containing alcohol dehydrogenase n=1 Tax=Octadecabacter antarcticus 307 TaxID=391626 RepID=M9RAI9_9RHOB|nr:iron-containing alcohol dehydrogenase [Octadecabacter antarcticus]AGI69664.1 putative iron-containing alcohol dehydrogenase [Octadecabacter antarcticus 307]